jgi:hypothetical protein
MGFAETDADAGKSEAACPALLARLPLYSERHSMAQPTVRQFRDAQEAEKRVNDAPVRDMQDAAERLNDDLTILLWGLVGPNVPEMREAVERCALIAEWMATEAVRETSR